MIGVSPSQLLPALQEVRRAELVVATATEALVFRSRLVRETLYQGIELPIRVALHRQIGEVLLERGGAAKDAAAHLIEGARAGDHRVLAALDEAVTEATRTSPASAATLALHALELTEPSDPGRPGRALVAVEALVTAERLGEAPSVARPTWGRRCTSGTPSASLRLALSSLHLGAARPRDAVNGAETVLEQSDLPDDIHGSAEAALLMGLLADEDLAGRGRLAEASWPGSDRPDSQLALATATMVLARVGWCEGRVASALGLARAAVRRADRFARGGFGFIRASALPACYRLGEFDEAEVLLAECREEIELSGDTVYRPGPVIARASLRLAAGRLKEAQSDAEAGCSIAEHLGARRFVPGGRDKCWRRSRCSGATWPRRAPTSRGLTKRGKTAGKR